MDEFTYKTEPPANRRAKQYVGTYVKGILVVVVFALGIYLGAVVNIGSVQERILQQKNSEVVGIKQLTEGFSEEVNTGLFWDIWDAVQKKYVEGPSEEADLFYGAIEGVVAALNDPYSVFLRPEITKQFVADLSGTFEGIGAEIGKREGRLVVVAPLANSPAEQAGLESGDIIVSIDGDEAAPLPLDSAVRKIRGPRDSTVVLEIYRESTDELMDISIVRAPIELTTVAYERLEKNIAYARIAHFNEQTIPKFESVIADVNQAQNQPAGLIIDLRNNPGGFLDVAVALTSEWLEEGAPIVKEDFYNGAGVDQQYDAHAHHRLPTIPTVVLINGGSASASEILAGALQDHERAIIIGEQTFGKGSVQEFRTFADGSGLKLTIAKWLTPSGRSIDDKGISPDIKVEDDPETEEDEVLQKATEVLIGEE